MSFQARDLNQNQLRVLALAHIERYENMLEVAADKKNPSRHMIREDECRTYYETWTRALGEIDSGTIYEGLSADVRTEIVDAVDDGSYDDVLEALV